MGATSNYARLNRYHTPVRHAMGNLAFCALFAALWAR
jgi:hypothetical protein